MKRLLFLAILLTPVSGVFSQDIDWIIKPTRRAFTNYYYYPAMDLVIVQDGLKGNYQLHERNGKKKKLGNFTKIESLFSEYFGDLALIKKNGKFGFINTKGKLVIDAKYSSVSAGNLYNYDQYVPVSVDGKNWGVIDKTGKEIVPFKYSRINPFDHSNKSVFNPDIRLVSVKLQNETNTVIDSEGNQLLPAANYPAEVTFWRNCALIRNSLENSYKHYKYNKISKEIEELPYEWVYSQHGLVQFIKGKKVGFLDNELNLVDGLYDAVIKQDGLILCRMNNDWITLDSSLKPSNRIILDSVSGLASIKTANGWQIVDRKDKKLTNNIYSFIFPIAKNGLAVYYRRNGQKMVENPGYLDRNGKDVVPAGKYDSLSANGFINDLLIFRHNDLFGVLNTAGNVVAPPKYEKIYEETFIYNMLLVKQNGKSGILDKFGRQIIPTIYDTCLPLNDSLILVKKFEKMGLLNNKGEAIIPVQYDYISPHHKNLRFSFIKDNESGVIDSKGKIILSIENAKVDLLAYDLVRISKYKVYRRNGMGVMNASLDGLVGKDAAVGVAKLPDFEK